MSKTIKGKAIAKAIAFLEAAGATFSITDNEAGIIYYSKDGPEAKKQNDFSPVALTHTLQSLEIGGIVRIHRSDYDCLASRQAWSNFKSVVCSTAKRIFGADNFIHARADDDSYVEVMRAA